MDTINIDAINIDAVTAFDLGLSAMTAKEARTAGIEWAAKSIVSFWSSSFVTLEEKREYLDGIVSGEPLKTVVLSEVLTLDDTAYRSVFPIVEYK